MFTIYFRSYIKNYCLLVHIFLNRFYLVSVFQYIMKFFQIIKFSRKRKIIFFIIFVFGKIRPVIKYDPLESFLSISQSSSLSNLWTLSNPGYYLLIVAAISSSSFSGKISSPVKNSYLITFLDDKAEVLAAYLSKLSWALFCSILLSIILNFSLTVILE